MTNNVRKNALQLILITSDLWKFKLHVKYIQVKDMLTYLNQGMDIQNKTVKQTPVLIVIHGYKSLAGFTWSLFGYLNMTVCSASSS